MTTQEKLHLEAITAWQKNGCRGLIQAPTGFGKSRIIALLAGHMLKHGEKVLIVVPTVTLRDEEMPEAFRKFGVGEYLGHENLEILCAASAHNQDLRRYTCLIVDEGHKIGGAKQFDVVRQNEYTYILGLSATFDENLLQLYAMYNLHIVWQIDLDTCLKHGIIAPFKTELCEVPLTEEERADYDKYSKTMTVEGEICGGFSGAQMIMASGKYNTPKGVAARKYQSAMTKRTALVKESANKIQKAHEIVDDCISQNECVIVFLGTTKKADQFRKDCEKRDIKVGVYVASSKKREQVLEDFKQGKLQVLVCINALNEGINIPNCKRGIVVARNSKSIELIQRIGRIIRLDEGREAILYNIVAENTVDHTWLTKQQK